MITKPKDLKREVNQFNNRKKVKTKKSAHILRDEFKK